MTGTGGIGGVFGTSVNAVTDPSGQVTMINGYFASATFGVGVGVGEAPPPPRSPRLIAEEMLRELAVRFVAPTSFARARRRLRDPGTLLVSGAAGSGRRTTALMLLHQSGDGANRFRELPDEVDDQVVGRLDPEAVEPGERLLLDLSGDQLVRLGRSLAEYHSAVLHRGAYCVVTLPEADHELPDELRTLVVRIERPDGRAVLRRHLSALGIVLPDDLDVPGLAPHLGSDPVRELARLALLVGETRDVAEGRGTVADWLERAIEALSVRVDVVAEQVKANPDGRTRALLLAAAVFERAPAEVVHHAADQLLATLAYPEHDQHRLDRPDLAESLRSVGAGTDGAQRVRFGTVTYAGAVRDHFWNSFPGLRESFREWLRAALPMAVLDERDRAEVLDRFAAQCLRTRHPEDLFALVRQLAEECPSLVAAAAGALARGLADERHSVLFRRRIYEWSREPRLARGLALELVRLCAEAIAPSRPEQAMVRLRHLTRNDHPEVSAAARDTLVALAAEDERFLRRVLHRLDEDLGRARPRDTDLELFTALAGPLLRLNGDQVVRCWRGLFGHREYAGWVGPVRRWLRGHHEEPGRDDLLDTLVAAAAGRSDVLARLYVVARDWAVIDPARRRTAAELLRRSDRAQGLYPADEPAPATSEGAFR